jgi:hypothetical protein
MTVCENNLFIQFDTIEKKEEFLSIIGNNQLLFQSFIELSGTKKECYGVDSDVYIEYITFDISEPNVINIVFYTYEYPCIPFCEKLSYKYSVHIQLLYFNEESDFSGKLEINKGIKNELYSYWQGVYILQYDLFWERLDDFFEKFPANSFFDFLQKNKMIIYEKDVVELQHNFDKYNLINTFKNL